MKNSSNSIIPRRLLLLFVIVAYTTPAQSSTKQNDLDRSLIESLLNKDTKTARDLLEKGANPDAVLGKRLTDSAACVAIDDRSNKYLKLLVEFGASPNAFWPNAGVTRRTPLACAIQLENFEAFDYLLAHGADPSVDLDPERPNKNVLIETVLNLAIGLKKYPMALELLQHHTAHQEEIRYMKYHLENSPFDESHPWHYARAELIQWLDERVTDFNPLPAAPIPENFVAKCLFSYHDLKEGLKNGTLCHRPEDL